MRLVWLTLLLFASCVRVDDDVLIAADRQSLLAVEDGAKISLLVKGAEFQRLFTELNGIFSVDVVDKRTGKYLLYVHSASEYVHGTSYAFVLSPRAGDTFDLHLRVAEVAPDPKLHPKLLGGSSSSVCVRLHFSDGIRIVQSRTICHES